MTEREEHIRGLRELANFLEANPDVVIPNTANLSVFTDHEWNPPGHAMLEVLLDSTRNTDLYEYDPDGDGRGHFGYKIPFPGGHEYCVLSTKLGRKAFAVPPKPENLTPYCGASKGPMPADAFDKLMAGHR